MLNEKLLEQVGRFLCPGVIEEKSDLTQETVLVEFEERLVKYESETIDTQDGTAKKKRVVGGALHRFVQQNYDRSFDYCTKFFDDLYNPIKAKILAHEASYTFNKALEDLKKLKEQFSAAAIGPAKWEINNNAKRAVIEADKRQFKQLMDFNEKLLKSAEEAERVQQQNAKLQEDLHTVRHQMEEDLELQKKNMEIMQKKHDEAMRQMEENEKKRRAEEEEKIEEYKKTNLELQAKVNEQRLLE